MASDARVLFPELAEEPLARQDGILPSQRLIELIDAGHLRAATPILAEQIQPSSIDLRLGPVGYRVPASFLPSRNMTVQKKLHGFQPTEIDLRKGARLERGVVYVVPLLEELHLPDNFSARANPKSSTGRLDIFTRLITDHAGEFDDVREGYRGPLYAEIVPLTFPVIVREGARLNQIRVKKGRRRAADKLLFDLHERDPILYSQDESPVSDPLISDGLSLSVDLKGLGSDIIGYKAKSGTPAIDLSLVNHYEVAKFWEPIRCNATRSVVLEPGAFYILASREKVSIPPHAAAEMLPFDPSYGEFRVHYAGFFDPGFGWNPDRPAGSHAVLEVRSYEVPSLLEDGQVVARHKYDPLMAVPSKI
jgi:dCTP deaminase